MCCKSFWKRGVSFCLAFLLGLLSFNLLSFEKLSSRRIEGKVSFEEKMPLEKVKSKPILTTERKNCFSDQPNFKYQYLRKERIRNTQLLEKQISEQPTTKLDLERQEEITKKIKDDLRKRFKEIEKSIKDAENPKSGIGNLLYLEYCYEFNGREQSKKTNR